jgi:hemerythrin-like domain-containing protein
MSTRATSELSADHQLILQAVQLLREMSDEIVRGNVVERDNARILLEFFREFVHEYHDSKEELILIPALVQSGQHLQDSPLNLIVAGHREIHELISAIESAFAAGNDPQFVRLSGQYQKLLADHVASEDRLLFDIVAKVLDDVSDRRVWQELNEFEPGLRERSKSKFQTIVHSRERKIALPLSI